MVINSSILLIDQEFKSSALLTFEQEDQINSDITSAINLHDIATKKVRIGDIDMAYKIIGRGDPILLISGFAAPLDFWGPILLKELGSNHTVITFDIRGIGNTSIGEKRFSMNNLQTILQD